MKKLITFLLLLISVVSSIGQGTLVFGTSSVESARLKLKNNPNNYTLTKVDSTFKIVGLNNTYDISFGDAATISNRTLTLTAGTGVTVTGGTQNLEANRTWTISIPQSVSTSASPVFVGITLSGLSNGILKSTSGVVSSSAIVNADISSSAAIDYTKITGLSVNTMAALKLKAGTYNGQLATLLGYYAYADGGEGNFYWNSTSTETDNGGTIIQVTGVSTGRWMRLMGESINVDWFGAKGDRNTTKTNDSAAVAKAISVGRNIKFGQGKSYYIQGRILISNSNTSLDLDESKIYFGGTSTGFVFGTVQDTTSITDITVKNGSIYNDNYTDTANRLFVVFNSVKRGTVINMNLYNVSNGGVYVTAGSSKISIKTVNIEGTSAYSTCRGIWLNGSTASDYASQLMNITTLARNTTPLPAIKVRDVEIEDVKIKYTNAGYGIYLMNTYNVNILDCNIDLGTSNLRCIAVNNHAPNTKIRGCTLKGSTSSTGILVTQFSDNVIISSNIFEGDFVGGRDIYVAYGAKAYISNNVFNTASNKTIEIDNNGSATIINNEFSKPAFVSGEVFIDINTIDDVVTGTSTFGDSATLVSKIYIHKNIFRNCTTPIVARQQVSTNSNIPGIEQLSIEDNKFFDMNNGTVSSRVVTLTSLNSTNKINIEFLRNYAYPYEYALTSAISDASGYSNIRMADFRTAAFLVTNPSAGGTITVTSLGDNGLFKLTTSRSGGNIILVPRTNGGFTGAAVARLVNIVPTSSNMASFTIADWSASNLTLTAKDSAGASIALNTTAASFIVYLSHKY